MTPAARPEVVRADASSPILSKGDGKAHAGWAVFTRTLSCDRGHKRGFVFECVVCEMREIP